MSFRVHSDLKKLLEEIAATEGRSVAQVCETFLKIGTENYKKNGNKLFQGALVKTHSRSKV